MTYMKIDVRGSTCPGGGALWSLLSHVRELPAGDSIEILTDDYMAGMDIPEYVRRRRWRVTRQQRRGYARYLVERPVMAAWQRVPPPAVSDDNERGIAWT